MDSLWLEASLVRDIDIGNPVNGGVEFSCSSLSVGNGCKSMSNTMLIVTCKSRTLHLGSKHSKGE